MMSPVYTQPRVAASATLGKENDQFCNRNAVAPVVRLYPDAIAATALRLKRPRHCPAFIARWPEAQPILVTFRESRIKRGSRSDYANAANLETGRYSWL
jgi:hypothetical protein